MENQNQEEIMSFNQDGQNVPSDQSRHTIPLRDFGFLVLSSAFLVILVSYPVLPEGKLGNLPGQRQTVLAVTAIESPKKEYINPFSLVDIKAESAFVLDVTNNKILFSKSESKRLPLASLTKIMTAITALSLAPENETVKILPEFLTPLGDTGFFVNESWDLKTLLDITLVSSSNDGAYAIAGTIGSRELGTSDYKEGRKEFLRRMNEMAEEIGLTETYFLNETGLDETDTVSGGYGSAHDMAHLFSYALKSHPDIFRQTSHTSLKVESLDGLIHTVDNTNTAINGIPRLISSKTGFTDLAGGNLVVAIDAGFDRPIVIVVLGSTAKERFDDVEELSWAAIESLNEPEQN
ncbi:MAG: hypothetical protein COV70_03085 [Parcubacteria group bacterium CG11_big_fil_rev_8_21_14_0_20_39_22]|nr:MAG: hypothetical protein COV70_03085 [Parcubacteria group bacterium CG11_big_fil_rev_8_21_14_0_20_39_22]